MLMQERSTLHVEGTDDVNTIKHLLRRHGINCLTKNDLVSGGNIASRNGPLIKGEGDKDKVLAAIQTAVPVSNDQSVGFVLDADKKAEDTWQAVRSKLRKYISDIPSKIPENGFVVDIDEFRVRVGVWLMPDNIRSGALEEFLEELIDQQDQLYPIAISSTEEAMKVGANFSISSKKRRYFTHGLHGRRSLGGPMGQP